MAHKDYTDEHSFRCQRCSQEWSLHPDTVVKRLEVTYVFKTEGVYRVAVCSRCGALVSPYLEEVNKDEV